MASERCEQASHVSGEELQPSTANSSFGAPTITMSRLNDEMSCIEDAAEGSFGLVKRGVLDMDLQNYAVKQTKKAIAGEGDLQQRLQEVYALSAFSHPNILRYFDGWVEDKAVYVRTEWLPEGSVAHLKKPVAETCLTSLLHQIASALHHLHAHDVAHRDVKPENILARQQRDGTFVFKLADFGLARPVTAPSEDTGEQFRGVNDDDGDHNYLCPEALSVCDAPHTGFEADVYALGASCVELMGGDPSSVRVGVYTGAFKAYSTDIQALLRSMTATDPKERPSAFFVASSTLNTEVLQAPAVTSRQAAISYLQQQIEELQNAA